MWGKFLRDGQRRPHGRGADPERQTQHHHKRPAQAAQGQPAGHRRLCGGCARGRADRQRAG